MLYSADDHYDDDITSGRSWEMDMDCDDCYPFECRHYSTCTEWDPFADVRED